MLQMDVREWNNSGITEGDGVHVGGNLDTFLQKTELPIIPFETSAPHLRCTSAGFNSNRITLTASTE